MQSLAFGLTGPATAIATDLTEGVIDRFRSLPGDARSAYLVGPLPRRARGHGAVDRRAARRGLHRRLAHAHRPPARRRPRSCCCSLFSSAMIWIGTWIGLMVRSPDAVMGVGFVVVFPLTFLSNAFVPINSLPNVLQWIAAWNPVSVVVARDARAVRQPGRRRSRKHTWPLDHPVVGRVPLLRSSSSRSRCRRRCAATAPAPATDRDGLASCGGSPTSRRASVAEAGDGLGGDRSGDGLLRTVELAGDRLVRRAVGSRRQAPRARRRRRRCARTRRSSGTTNAVRRGCSSHAHGRARARSGAAACSPATSASCSVPIVRFASIASPAPPIFVGDETSFGLLLAWTAGRTVRRRPRCRCSRSTDVGTRRGRCSAISGVTPTALVARCTTNGQRDTLAAARARRGACAPRCAAVS